MPVDLSAVLGGRRRRKARALDLSLVGCLLRTDAALARGAVLDLTLELPDGPLRTKGRVAEASLDGEAPPGPQSFLAGFEFLALAPVEEARLRVFLDAEAKRRRGANTPPA
jgi:PilZ domain